MVSPVKFWKWWLLLNHQETTVYVKHQENHDRSDKLWKIISTDKHLLICRYCSNGALCIWKVHTRIFKIIFSVVMVCSRLTHCHFDVLVNVWTMPNSNQNNIETEYPTHIWVTALFHGYLLTEHDIMAARWINLLNN
jgi:hypothetical protein